MQTSRRLLRTTLVVDYQNIHLTGAGLFYPTEPAHHHLIHPLQYAKQVLGVRNRYQRPGYPAAALHKVLVYRGLPSAKVHPRSYARNQAHRASWERDDRVTVFHRPLKYRYVRDRWGRKIINPNGAPQTVGRPEEKGIDVLCALAVIREVRESGIDLVILCSHDTDLEPALEEAAGLKMAKVETTSWFERTTPASSRQLRSRHIALWNTRLSRREFDASVDRRMYD